MLRKTQIMFLLKRALIRLVAKEADNGRSDDNTSGPGELKMVDQQLLIMKTK